MRIITKAVFALLLLSGVSTHGQAQFKGLVNDAQKAAGNIGNNGGKPSESEIGDGLRQALKIGAKNATGKVSATNGFFEDALIKVLMPPETKKVENTLRSVGMGDQMDKLILSMNRGAEDASTKALDIFVDAITHMTIQDALSILNGGNDAATQYLKRTTSVALTNAFKPVIKQSLDKVHATEYWATVFDTYNKMPTTFKKVNPDLPAYVTERALNGVFVYIAQEEAKIRKDPAAQVTDLLKKVFGSH